MQKTSLCLALILAITVPAMAEPLPKESTDFVRPDKRVDDAVVKAPDFLKPANTKALPKPNKDDGEAIAKDINAGALNKTVNILLGKKDEPKTDASQSEADKKKVSPVANALSTVTPQTANARPGNGMKQVDMFNTAKPVVVKKSEKSALEDEDTKSVVKSIKYKPADKFPQISYPVNNNSEILMKSGVNVMIPIAINHPNRIITPFKNPQVISTTLTGGTESNCGEICVRQGIVYISTNKKYPVTVFITEKGDEKVALSLTLLPRAIPPRQVTLTLPQSVLDKMDKVEARQLNPMIAQAWESNSSYVEMIRDSMRRIALGEVPDGYSLRKPKHGDVLPICTQKGLSFYFTEGQVLEGYNLNYYVGIVRNTSDKPIEFLPQSCGDYNVAAVSSYPLTLLSPKQTTEVYVAVKQGQAPAPSSVRAPLIEREYN